MDLLISIFSENEWILFAAIATVVIAVVRFGETLAAWLGWLLSPLARWLRKPRTYGDYALPDHKIAGRLDEIKKLGHVIRAQKCAVLIGSGGLGKSTLARYFVSKRKQNYRGVWWIDTSDATKLREATEALAKTLDPTLKGETDANLLVARARDLICDMRQRWLLIFDNADSPRVLRTYMPELRNGLEVIVTTRWSEWPEGGNYTPIPLQPLGFSTEASPAPALLMQEAKRTTDPAGAQALAETLGGLPLALVNAGAYLRDAPDVTFAAYAEDVGRAIAQAPPEGGDYPDSVFAAVSLSLERLSEEAKQFANLLAFWAPEGLEPAVFRAVGSANDEDKEHERLKPIPADLWSVLQAEGAVAQAFAEQVRRSLLERRGEGQLVHFVMHRLTGAVIRARLGAEGRVGLREAAASVLAAAYPWVEDKTFGICAALTPHVQALAGHGADSAAANYLYNQAAIYLGQMRQDLPALMLARASIRAIKKLHEDAPLHRDIGAGYTTLGSRWKYLGRTVIAEKLLARAAEIAEQNPETTDETKAIRLSNHGLALEDRGRRAQATGKADEAADWFRRAARRYQQALLLDRRRGDRRAVAKDLNNLGSLRVAQGRRAAAIRLGQMAVKIHREVLAADDTDLAIYLHNLAARLMPTPDWRDAEPLLDEALAIREDACAAYPRHPSRVGTADFLATAALMRGERGKAEAIIARYPDDLDLEKLERDALARHLLIKTESGEVGPELQKEIPT